MLYFLLEKELRQTTESIILYGLKIKIIYLPDKQRKWIGIEMTGLIKMAIRNGINNGINRIGKETNKAIMIIENGISEITTETIRVMKTETGRNIMTMAAMIDN
ncbi:MAG: hypothetical protein ABJA32_01875 [Ginsengibacter sp.]